MKSPNSLEEDLSVLYLGRKLPSEVTETVCLFQVMYLSTFLNGTQSESLPY